MAAATTRSTGNDSAVYNRGTKEFTAMVALDLGTADIATTGDIVPIMELPPEAILTSLKVLNAAIGASLAVDIGIYKAKKGLSLDELDMDTDVEALDADIYVDGSVELATANLVPTEILGSGTNAVSADDIYKTVRVLGSVTIGEDPFKYFLGLKTQIDANPLTGGAVAFIVSYVQG